MFCRRCDHTKLEMRSKPRFVKTGKSGRKQILLPLFDCGPPNPWAWVGRERNNMRIELARQGDTKW